MAVCHQLTRQTMGPCCRHPLQPTDALSHSGIKSHAPHVLMSRPRVLVRVMYPVIEMRCQVRSGTNYSG